MAKSERKDQFVAKLTENGGRIDLTCKAVGIDKGTYYNWRKKDPEFASTCDFTIAGIKAAREAAEEKLKEPRRSSPTSAPASFSEPIAEYPEVEASIGEKRAQEIAAEHEAFLRTRMNDAGFYSSVYDPQIAAAGRLWASIHILFEYLDRYAPLLKELTREGNTRLVANPVHEMIRRQADSYTRILQTLGLNFETKAKAAGEDSLADFFRKLDGDD